MSLGHSYTLTSRFPTLLIHHQHFDFCSTEGDVYFNKIQMPSHLQHKIIGNCWCERTLSDVNKYAALFANVRDTFHVIPCNWLQLKADMMWHVHRRGSSRLREHKQTHSRGTLSFMQARQLWIESWNNQDNQQVHTSIAGSWSGL